ncbi:hypothetical protein HUW51_10285 [Adhaeribacter swui]|uniref:Uncharacterized protein n=1 Tax=Adhaeribacter swui TaxID=2086471 RepID=A0A7G7G7G3_9BACT|nr:hypothetical protein [Adhaeribacter swui]QNF33097.1 hypothetical protein HUW51_10285 [Adhaeribacter swui]
MEANPVQAALDELLKLVYEEELKGAHLRNNMINMIAKKHGIHFNALLDRMEAEEVLEASNKYTFLRLLDKGRRVQEQGGYLAWLSKEEHNGKNNKVTNLDRFFQVLQYLADHSQRFLHVSDILNELSIADHNNELANAIDIKLTRSNLVFATEESGVKINENGLQLLYDHKFDLSPKSSLGSFNNSGVINYNSPNSSSNQNLSYLNNKIHNQGDGNFINTGNNSSINNKVNIEKNNFDVLRKLLAENHLASFDIDELQNIIDEQPDAERRLFGPKVNSWIQKMLNKSLDGSWQVGIGTAGTLLAEALTKYYGI